jgi:hypothetical protein
MVFKSQSDRLVFHETVWYYHEINGKEYEYQKRGREHSLPINFDRDFVLLTGELDREAIRSFKDQAFAAQVKKVVVPARLLEHVGELLEPEYLITQLGQLQELRVLLQESGGQYSPEPAWKFRFECPLHQHVVFPSKYCGIKDGHGYSVEHKQICPACKWVTGNWGDLDPAVMRCQYGKFRFSYDASLGTYHGRSTLVDDLASIIYREGCCVSSIKSAATSLSF